MSSATACGLMPLPLEYNHPQMSARDTQLCHSQLSAHQYYSFRECKTLKRTPILIMTRSQSSRPIMLNPGEMSLCFREAELPRQQFCSASEAERLRPLACLFLLVVSRISTSSFSGIQLSLFSKDMKRLALFQRLEQPIFTKKTASTADS